ncbi:MAG: hypothetical protein ACKOCX_00825 [Planctomycetota bacterium]
MAKSTRPSQRASAAASRSNTRAESWLTAAERKLLDGSLGRSLAEATQKQLQATMARARTLRDKWRDLFNRQMKASKRIGRAGEQVNSRSLDKAELFAAAVRRIEARLSELAAPAAPAQAEPRAAARPGNGPAKPVASKPAKSKKARQAGALKAVAATGGAVGYDRRKQRSAKASATAARIKLDGLSTRRRGHTLAAGKRKQARRDGR